MKESGTGQVLIYQSESGQTRLEVRLVEETVWLTQTQMAELFQTSPDNIGLHLKNIFEDRELEEMATTEDFSVVCREEKKQKCQTLKDYNQHNFINSPVPCSRRAFT